MKAVVFTNEMVNEVLTGIYGQGAVLTFIEDMEMEAVVVYDGEKIKRIIEMDDVLFDLGKSFNRSFISYEAVELGELGFGYAFKVPATPAPEQMASCA